MISYRLFCIKEGRIVANDMIEAPDDVAAIEAARAQARETDCELWQEGRLIAFIASTRRGGA